MSPMGISVSMWRGMGWFFSFRTVRQSLQFEQRIKTGFTVGLVRSATESLYDLWQVLSWVSWKFSSWVRKEFKLLFVVTSHFKHFLHFTVCTEKSKALDKVLPGVDLLRILCTNPSLHSWHRISTKSLKLTTGVLCLLLLQQGSEKSISSGSRTCQNHGRTRSSWSKKIML